MTDAQTSPVVIEVLEAPFVPETRLQGFRESLADVGALVSFTGVVRAEKTTDALILSHYPRYTEKKIAEIVGEARQRFGLSAVLVLHRVGRMVPGEPIVLVAAASAHRREAFEGATYLMDYLKSTAPFWKKEEGAQGARWIEPRADDIENRERWET